MSEAEKQEGQKTVVAFIAGLLIGGLLVWVFSGPSHDDHHQDGEKHDEAGEMNEEMSDETSTNDEVAEDDSTETTTTPEMQTGDGAIVVSNQAAGSTVTIDSATFPNDEGWIAVRSYQNDQLGNILGAARFSKEQNLVPEAVSLLVPTTAGNSYAVVFFTEDGNREFNLSGDAQVEGVWSTFTAE